MAQDTSHEPRKSIGKVFSQDPCEMSGCLKDLCVVSRWMLISSQDLETISFQKPIDLLDKTFQWDGQPPQRPSSRKMHQLLQLLVAISQQNTSRIFTGDSSGIPSEVNVATIEPLPASVARRDLVACGLPTLGCPP